MSNHLLQACPSFCQDSDLKENRFVYRDAARLGLCNEPMLLDFAFQRNIDNDTGKTAINACTANLGHVMGKAPHAMLISVEGSMLADRRIINNLLATDHQVTNFVAATPINSTAAPSHLVMRRTLASVFKRGQNYTNKASLSIFSTNFEVLEGPNR
ncbi:hypothetical protein CCHL11_06098 [Colletotrichum chlorophyti]|uniref:Uncharacterized protein n=1 Tax=Colletotrichum chlorophyti TaxID=708187 RepID=A0A1Q8RT34_9PEZI|nr:hypothetical protein CCHL11_06098 [Colletotrichum chlorophyti]